MSLSSEAAPVINEYERTSTVAADAYIKPAVSRYIQGVERDLSELGYGGQLLVMHSAGGVLGADAASERPIRLLESGPAAGALAAGFYSEMLGEPDLISLDMGGTTAKTCVIEGGQPSQSNGIEVARVHRFKSGSGLADSHSGARPDRDRFGRREHRSFGQSGPTASRASERGGESRAGLLCSRWNAANGH